MATTKNGFYYQDNYSVAADVPEDLKKLAESVDKFADNIQQEQATQNQKILNNSNNLDLVAEQLGETEQGFLQYKLENNQRVTYAEQNIIDLQGRERLNKENIETLQQEVQELEQDVKANAITEETEQAKSLKITDASGARGKLSILGNDEQETREGKNLWNDTSIENKKVSELANTQVSTSNLALTEGDYCFKLFFKDNTYMQTNISIQLKNAENTALKTISNQSSVTLTAEEAKQIVSGVCWTNSTGLADYANKTIAGLMLVKGTTLTDGYEKYGASPSLDYPSAIKSLGSNINLATEVLNNLWYSTDTNKFITMQNTVSVIAEIPQNANITINKKNGGNRFAVMTSYTKPQLDVDLTTVFIDNENPNRKTYTFKNTDKKWVWVGVQNGGTEEDKQKAIEEIKIEEGETATSYSPVGQGSTKIKKTNRNYLDSFNYYTANTSKTINGITFKINPDGTITANGTATANAFFDFSYTHVIGTNKKMIINNIGGTATGTVRFTAYNKDFSTTTSVLRETTGTQEMNLSDNIEYSIFRYAVYQNAVCNNLTLGFMVLDKTETDRTYTQHQEENYILNIQQEMLKEDYFDLDRKKEIHNWNEKIWNGTENWTVDSQNTNDTYISFKTQIDDMISLNSQNTQLIADKIINEYGGIALNKEHLWVYGIYIEVCVKKERLETLDATGFKKLLAQNNINIFYKLAIPTELDLTESQIEVLEKLNKLRYYEGVNNILTTEDIALLQAIYPVNLKNVNNKMQEEIDEIKELLSTTQTSAMLLDNLEQDLIKEVE